MADNDTDDADRRRDAVLKRMLKTPPKPHKPPKGKEEPGRNGRGQANERNSGSKSSD